MNTVYKVAIIGLGRVGMMYGLDKKRIQPASHVEAIIRNRHLNLVAVCDSSEETLRLFRKKYGSNKEIFKDYRNLTLAINNKKIECDILVISTPDETHYEILQYIGKNLHVNKPKMIFCEKPLSMDFKSAKKLIPIIKKSGLRIVVNHSRRWSKTWNYAHTLTKKIGKIKMAFFVFSTSPENKEVSQIRDGIHIADFLSWFKISEVTLVKRLKLSYFVYDFYLWGDKGKIEILDVGKTLNFYQMKKSTRFSGFNELKLISSKQFKESMLSNAYDEFVRFLDGKKSLSTDFNDAITALKIFEQKVYDQNLSIAKIKL